jgi:hypothetical protein
VISSLLTIVGLFVLINLVYYPSCYLVALLLDKVQGVS